MPESVSYSGEMPFLEHLEELRWRIIRALVATVVAVAIGFLVVLRYDVIDRLEAPILPFLHGQHVMATHPTDGLQSTISAATWIGGILAFPVIVYQAWLFLAPALFAAAGLVSPQMLNRYRRHAIVLIVAAGAFLTPGDFVWSTLALAVPLYLLYEVSVVVAYVIWRQKRPTGQLLVLALAPILVWRHHRTAAVS